jgi:uncharacterized membrane protein
VSAFTRLVKGPPGHPVHPPFTDATIGMYTLAAVLVVLGAAGWIEDAAAKGAWLALVVGLAFGVVTAATGLADWLSISRGTPLFRTASTHLVVMVSATALFALAAVFQYDGYVDGNVTTPGLVLTLAGFVALMAGGWIGGTIVYVHGMRVLSLPDEPSAAAIAPGGERKEKAAA